MAKVTYPDHVKRRATELINQDQSYHNVQKILLTEFGQKFRRDTIRYWNVAHNGGYKPKSSGHYFPIEVINFALDGLKAKKGYTEIAREIKSKFSIKVSIRAIENWRAKFLPDLKIAYKNSKISDPAIIDYAMSLFDQDLPFYQIANKVFERFGRRIHQSTIESWAHKLRPDVDIKKRGYDIVKARTANMPRRPRKGPKYSDDEKQFALDCLASCQDYAIVTRLMQARFGRSYKTSTISTWNLRYNPKRVRIRIPVKERPYLTNYAISLFNAGNNFAEISDNILSQFRQKVAPSTILSWIRKEMPRAYSERRKRISFGSREDPEVILYCLQCIKQGFNFSQTARKASAKFKRTIPAISVGQYYKRFKDNDTLGPIDKPVAYGSSLPPQILKFAIPRVRAGSRVIDLQKAIMSEFGVELSPVTIIQWREKYGPKPADPALAKFHHPPEAIAYAIKLAKESDLPTLKAIVSEVNRKFNLGIPRMTVNAWITRMAGIDMHARHLRLKWPDEKTPCGGCGIKRKHTPKTQHNKWRKFNDKWYCGRCIRRIKRASKWAHAPLDDYVISQICRVKQNQPSIVARLVLKRLSENNNSDAGNVNLILTK